MPEPDDRLVQQRLASIIEMLAADDYRVDLAVDEDHLRFNVSAGPDACADCLVGEDLMVSMIRDALGDAVPAGGVSVTYPGP